MSQLGPALPGSVRSRPPDGARETNEIARSPTHQFLLDPATRIRGGLIGDAQALRDSGETLALAEKPHDLDLAIGQALQRVLLRGARLRELLLDLALDVAGTLQHPPHAGHELAGRSALAHIGARAHAERARRVDRLGVHAEDQDRRLLILDEEATDELEPADALE